SGSPLNNRSDQQVSAPEIFVIAIDRLWIIGIVQPESAHKRKARHRAFADGAVYIRKKPVAQLKIFAANGLDLCIVQFTPRGYCCPFIAADFHRTRIASVPTPGQAKRPVAAVTTEQRAKRSELKPAQIKFGSEVFGRNKSSNICAPIRNA